jgi:AraC-like DNA-binding protein
MGCLHVNSAAVADKYGFWERTIHRAFGAVDIKIADESNFFGELRTTPFGNFDFAEVVCDYEIATRTRRHIVQDETDSFVLVLLRTGRLQIGQLGRECVLTSGTFSLFDLNTPYTFCHVERTEVLDLVIPGPLLRSRLRDPQSLVARHYSASNGVGRITADLLTSLVREAETIPSWVTHGYCSRMIDLIGILFEAAQDDLPIANSAVRSALYRRCVAIIETHLADPAIGPTEIANLAGISVRYLHRIFQDTGESVANLVRQRRLDRCHRDLSDPAKRTLSIGEIAYRVGFRNQSHFTNSFKRQYGMSPSEVRQFSSKPKHQ